MSETQDKNQQNESEQNEGERINKSLFIYQNLFVSSVVSTVMLIKKVSTSNEQNISEDKKISHQKMLQTCEEILNQYKNKDNKTDVDQVKIIKKVFNVLREHLDLIKNKDSNLFLVRTKENKILTIIKAYLECNIEKIFGNSKITYLNAF